MSEGLDCIVEMHRHLRLKKKCYMVVESIIMRLIKKKR